MAGHGNTVDTAVWGAADVLISSNLSATIPADITTAFQINNGSTITDQWDFVGLLDGGQGFAEAIETNSTDHSAWGFGVVATTYGDTKLTKTFTALEENKPVMSLVYDTSGMTFDDATGTYSGDLGVKDFTTRVKVAFVTYSGGVEKRFISKNYATIAPSNAGTESETALQSKGFTVTVYPDSSGKYWTAQKG